MGEPPGRPSWRLDLQGPSIPGSGLVGEVSTTELDVMVPDFDEGDEQEHQKISGQALESSRVEAHDNAAERLVSLVVQAKRQGLVDDASVWRLQTISKSTRKFMQYCEVDLLRIPSSEMPSQMRPAPKVPHFDINWLVHHFKKGNYLRIELQGIAVQAATARQCWAAEEIASALRYQKSCLRRLWVREIQFGELSTLFRGFPALTEVRLLRCKPLGPSLEPLNYLSTLRELYIGECHGLHNLEGGSALQNLNRLSLVQLNNFTSLAGIEEFQLLRELHLIALEALGTMGHAVSYLPRLQALRVASCPLLDLSKAGSTQCAQDSRIDLAEVDTGSLGLRAIALGYLASMHDLPRSLMGTHLTRLQINLSPITTLGVLVYATSLEDLTLAYLELLPSLHGVEECLNLRRVQLKCLPLVSSLDPLEKMLHLQSLHVKGCPLVKTIPSSLICSSELKKLEFFAVGSQEDEDEDEDFM